jgi:hypothetical protein
VQPSSDSVPASRAARGMGRARRVGLISAPGQVAGAQRTDRAGISVIVQRRRVVALAALGLLFVAALVIPLVVLGGDRNSAKIATTLTTTAQTATTLERPTTATPTTTTTTPQSEASGAPPLRVALPNGALRRGDRGSAVEKLQRGLAAIGYATGEPDGIFGQVTESAVIDFQRSNNLDPDGLVGTDTVRLLNSALARRGVTE